MIEDIFERKTKHCEISIHFDLYYNEIVELERPENVLDIVQEVVARTDFEECYRQGKFRLLNDVHFLWVKLPDSDTEIDLGYEDDMQEILRHWGRMRKKFNQTRKHLDDNILHRRTRHCQVSLRHGAVYTETVNLAKPQKLLKVIKKIVRRTNSEKLRKEGRLSFANYIDFFQITIADSGEVIPFGYDDDDSEFLYVANELNHAEDL